MTLQILPKIIYRNTNALAKEFVTYSGLIILNKIALAVGYFKLNMLKK